MIESANDMFEEEKKHREDTNIGKHSILINKKFLGHFQLNIKQSERL